MPNNLYNTFGNTNNVFAQIAQQAKEFKQSFQGNPREEVERLLNTGAMSQADFNRLSQLAQQITQFIN